MPVKKPTIAELVAHMLKRMGETTTDQKVELALEISKHQHLHP